MQSCLYAAVKRSVFTAVFFSPVMLSVLAVTTARAQSNPIVIENQQPGTMAWQISTKVANDTTGQIKGYASAPSINKGENITFYVTTNPAQTFAMDVYRMGWYQGNGARLMQHVDSLNGITQATCPRDATTGMIECNWTPSYTLTTQSSWTSGVYIVLLTNAQGYQNFMTFVMRDDNRVAQLIYNQPVMTAQAYNDYPADNATGKSLYEYNSYGPNTPATGTTRAAKVSFDRPYSGMGVNDFWVMGEVNFIRWVERSGFDITYSTDLDLHTDGYRLLNYHGFLAVGHPEYWSKAMFDAAVTARNGGINLGFFGADSVYWQIRMESSSRGVANRVVVCYKDATRDPLQDPTLKTVLWRDPPLNRPDQTLVGVQYTSMPPYNNNFFAPYVVTNSSHWVYAGTGLKDGDSLPALVGYEADRLFSEYPGPDAVAGTYTLLSHSPYQSVSGPDYGNSSIYQAQSGSWVFASGSMNFNWGLDSYPDGIDHGNFPAGVVDARIQQTAANILNRFSLGIQPDFSLSALPSSQPVAPGGSISYSVTINPSNGFTNAVTLSVSGLPTGATGVFTPNPATGSSTLAVTTIGSTPVGTYPLTITGVSSTLTHTTSVTLAVNFPDFTLSATPPSQTLLQGAAGNYSVTITPTGGFTSGVTLSVSGLPAGATGTFTPNPATGSSTLAVTTSGTTPIGTYPLTISGVSGSLNHTTSVSLSVVTTLPPPGVVFDAVGPSSGGASVASGSSLTWNHTVTASGSNLLLTVAVAVGASPDTGKTLAVTYNGIAMTPAGIVHSNNQNLGFVQLFYLAAPATGTHAVLVTLTGGTASLEAGSLSFTGVDQTTPVRNVATNFGSGVSPTVTVTSASGDMVVDALVSGCDGTFVSSKTLRWLKSLNCATAGGNAAQSTAAGASSVTMGYTIPSDYWGIIGADIVAAPGQAAIDFTLTNEGDKSVTQGSTVTNTVTATLVSGVTQSATFTASGLPTGVTASFSQGSCSPTCSTILTLNASASAAVGSAPITVTATAGSVSRTTIFTLNVTAPTTADFTLSATPGSQTVAQGASGNYSVTVNPTNGFTGAVTLSVTGLPAGATGVFTPNPATGTSTLAVATSGTTPAGTSTLTITGVSGSLTHTTTVSLTVSVPDFTLSATPPSQTVLQGASGNYNVTVNPTGGFSAGVTLTVTGLPAGATGTFTPNPATGTSALAVTTSGGTPAGTSTLTITGVSGTLTHTTTVSLTVSVPDFTLSATPPSQTVLQGASGNYSVTVNPTGGFTGGVTLSVSGLPAGATGGFTPNPATGSSALAVTTSGTTPAGTYPLTITGVSGALTHTAAVSLTVNLPGGTITVTAPNTAVSWKATSAQNIKFTHNLGVGKQVNIDVSRDGGSTWSPITVFTTTSATSGTYSWVVTSPATTRARIRVSFAANPLVTDMSDVDFTITNPTITVTSPNTAVSWRAGDTKNITFSHTMGVGQTVNIQVSRDGGVTWALITTFTTTSASSGSYPWVVSGPPTTQARIRVTWTADPTVTDTSDVSFTILPRTTVTAPNTAVTYGAGSTRQITWSHNLGVGGLVDIAFSPDSGVTWVPLAQGVASNAATTGTYTTRMPTTVTTQALIRVAPSIDSTLGDVSDVPFTLAAPTITVTAPNPGATWRLGASNNIKWSHNLGTGESVRIDLARDGVNYTETLAASVVNSANASGTFAWVVTGPATTTARIRVTWLANGAVTDASDTSFTIR